MTGLGLDAAESLQGASMISNSSVSELSGFFSTTSFATGAGPGLGGDASTGPGSGEGVDRDMTAGLGLDGDIIAGLGGDTYLKKK